MLPSKEFLATPLLLSDSKLKKIQNDLFKSIYTNILGTFQFLCQVRFGILSCKHVALQYVQSITVVMHYSLHVLSLPRVFPVIFSVHGVFSCCLLSDFNVRVKCIETHVSVIHRYKIVLLMGSEELIQDL